MRSTPYITKTYPMLIIAICSALLAVSSCTIAKISGRGSVPLMLNNPPARIEVISHFSASKTIVFDYTGAFDVSEILADKLSGSDADAVTNLVVSVKSTVGSFFINVITLGIAYARVLEVEGDLVKAPNGLGQLEAEQILARFDDLDQLATHLRPYTGAGALPTLVRLDEGYALIATP